MQATAERVVGGGFRRNSVSELKLKNRCTGSTCIEGRSAWGGESWSPHEQADRCKNTNFHTQFARVCQFGGWGGVPRKQFEQVHAVTGGGGLQLKCMLLKIC